MHSIYTSQPLSLYFMLEFQFQGDALVNYFIAFIIQVPDYCLKLGYP